MNAQRHTPDELDRMADTVRDEAIRFYLNDLPPDFHHQPDTEHDHWTAHQIDTRVGLTRLLRDEAARLRRLHQAARTRDGQSAS